jgi:hypothetical protein
MRRRGAERCRRFLGRLQYTHARRAFQRASASVGRRTTIVMLFAGFWVSSSVYQKPRILYPSNALGTVP